jgi:GNAT superfamily N-acetyltransferase
LSKIVIRASDDWDTIQELDREAFPTSPKLTDEELSSSVWWLAYLDGVPVAYAGIWLIPAKKKAFLTRAAVAKIAQGQGLQKRLIRVRLRHAKRAGIPRVYTYTQAGNFASMKSLIACGLRPYYTSYGEANAFIYFETRRAA